MPVEFSSRYEIIEHNDFYILYLSFSKQWQMFGSFLAGAIGNQQRDMEIDVNVDNCYTNSFKILFCLETMNFDNFLQAGLAGQFSTLRWML